MRRILLPLCVLTLVTALLIPLSSGQTTPVGTAHVGSGEIPVVDPDYIYNQLFYMATHFQRREAGYDTNLPPLVNGHDEFATYWANTIQADLSGFGPAVKRDTFPIQGWKNRPAALPAVNVEVTVPGLIHPEQIVIIGCHYDGEAFSTQSANDDASGCAIELGVANAMGAFWRAHHMYPARTLRFVLYDAEEQGIYGSFHYVNETVNGDLRNIVAMFNEEQSGIGYPLRYLGDIANPMLPMYAFLSPLQDNEVYPTQSALTSRQRTAITTFRALMTQAVPAVFAEFRALGYTSLTYHDTSGKPVPQAIFTPDQQADIQFADDNVGASDEIPFTLAGLPCATFSGNFTYYDRDMPPPWSYPYDQPQDTIQLMNTYASGTANKAAALVLALALPGMLTTWMLAQPEILGEVAQDGSPVAAVSDIGKTVPGKPLSLDARASFAPSGSSSLTYSWSFGDGKAASGVSVAHTYTAAGTYLLTLTVSSPGGRRKIVKTLSVTDNPPGVSNPYADYQPDGYPRANPLVALPTPNPALGQTALASRQRGASTGDSVSAVLVYVLIIALALLCGGIVLFALRRRAATARGATPGWELEEQQRRVQALRSLAHLNPAATPPPPPYPPDAPPPQH